MWSQDPYEKSDTRKTKSATVYRYNDKEHVWDEGVVTVVSTCTVNGVSVHNCSHCDKVKNQPLPLDAHSYAKEYTTDLQATASKAGSESRHCKNCSAITGKRVISKISRFEASFKSKVYNGKKQTPKITVYDEKGKKLTDKTDYTLKFSEGSINPGKYVATITLKGRYKGTKKINYTITPRSPQKLKFTSSTTAVKLTWSKANEATGYKVFIYDTKAREYKEIKATTATSFTHKTRNNGTKYTYIVKAYKKIGDQYINSASSKIVTATKPLSTTISLKSPSKGKVTVGWKNVVGENGFQIFYSTKKDGEFKKLTNCKANSTKLTKGSFKTGTTYYFKVRAYKNAGDGYVYSAFSSVKSIKVK